MTEHIITKQCSGCKLTKELSAFAKNRAMRDNLNNECKTCNQKRHKARSQTPEYKEQRSKYVKEYKEEAPKHIDSLTKKETQRFWDKARIGGSDDCWEWQASCSDDGYGAFWLRRRYRRAHRIAYIITNGAIDTSVFICHSCDNRKCCNPNHLWLGDNAANLKDAADKGRMASKKNGRHGRYTKPHRTARGERSGPILHPESYTGEKNSQAKLTEQDVKEIRRIYAQEKPAYRTLAETYGVSIPAIYNIVARKYWRHLL